MRPVPGEIYGGGWLPRKRRMPFCSEPQPLAKPDASELLRTGGQAFASAGSAIRTAISNRGAEAVTVTSDRCDPLGSAAVSAVSATAGAILFGLGFVNIQRPAAHVTAVQRGNGTLSFAIVAHFHESKPTGPSRVPIRDDIYSVNRAELLKQGSNGAFS